MNESRTRWIIGSATTVLWVANPLAAAIDVALHWYLAIWLATGIASLGGLACLTDAMARARNAQNQAARKAANDDILKAVCTAIGDNTRRLEVASASHARRMEAATDVHGERLRSDVLSADRFLATTWRGETLGKLDAALEAAARNARGTGTGPMPIISGH